MKNEMFQSVHKVRSYELDSYGHVNNATYLNYLEFARMEILENKGLSLKALLDRGYRIVIHRVQIAYRHPAIARDMLIIHTHLHSCRKMSGVFHQRINRERDGKLIAEAEVFWVTTNLDGKPVRFPPEIREAFGIEI